MVYAIGTRIRIWLSRAKQNYAEGVVIQSTVQPERRVMKADREVRGGLEKPVRAGHYVLERKDEIEVMAP